MPSFGCPMNIWPEYVAKSRKTKSRKSKSRKKISKVKISKQQNLERVKSRKSRLQKFKISKQLTLIHSSLRPLTFTHTLAFALTLTLTVTHTFVLTLTPFILIKNFLFQVFQLRISHFRNFDFRDYFFEILLQYLWPKAKLQ